jgi:hypothetical protein
MGIGYLVRSSVCRASAILSSGGESYLIRKFPRTAQDNGLPVSGRSALRGLTVCLAVKVLVAAGPVRVAHVMVVSCEIV